MASQLAEFLELWAAQPRYALALHTLSDEELAAAAATAGGLGGIGAAGKLPRPGSAGDGSTADEPRQRLQGIAVCWDLQQAFFLELSGERPEPACCRCTPCRQHSRMCRACRTFQPGLPTCPIPTPAAHCAREPRQGGAATLLDAVSAVLAKSTCKVCYGASNALPELLQLGEWVGRAGEQRGWQAGCCSVALGRGQLRLHLLPCVAANMITQRRISLLCAFRPGIQLGGRLEDPRAAAALLWPDAAAEDPSKLSLKRIQASAAPRYKVRLL